MADSTRTSGSKIESSSTDNSRFVLKPSPPSNTQFLLVRPWLPTQQFRCQRILSLDPFWQLWQRQNFRDQSNAEEDILPNKKCRDIYRSPHGMLWRVCGKSSIFIYVPFQSPCSAPVNQQPVTTCMRRLFFLVEIFRSLWRYGAPGLRQLGLFFPGTGVGPTLYLPSYS